MPPTEVTGEPRHRGPRLRPTECAALGALALLLCWLALPDRPEAARVAVSNAVWLLAPVWAGVHCLRAARRSEAARDMWLLLGLGTVSWEAGSVVYALNDVAGDTRFPSLADAGFAGLPLLAVAALLRAPDVARTTAARWRLLTDGAVVAAALLLLARLFGLGEGDGGGRQDRYRLAFAACAVLAAAVAVLVLDRLRRAPRSRVFLAALAVLVVTLSDVVYSTMASSGGYLTGGLFDVTWPAGFLLLGAAAARPAAATPVVRVDGGHRAVPLLPAVAAGLALVASGRLATGLDSVLVTAVVTLGAALTARQLLLAGDNAALHRSLEQRVAERTAALHSTEQLYRHRAYTDPLTGLANRDAFTEALAHAAAQGSGHVGVVMLDLDGFKQVNDGFGHEHGDDVLVAVAERLSRRLAQEPEGSVLLARLGGDEFGLLLPDLAGPADAEQLAGDLVQLLRANFSFGDREVFLGTSAGMSLATRPLRRPPTELLREADTAMYAAKRAGGSSLRRYDDGMRSLARERMTLESDLHRALEEGELTLHYQPIHDLERGLVVGVEALSRWTHPKRGPISPLDFIPAAERTGLIVDLERQQLDAACAQLAAWRLHTPDLNVGINISARSLREPDVVEAITSTVRRHGLPPSAVILEVTESLFFHDEATVAAVLGGLHEAGIPLALDDFGTGFSSLSRLSKHPFSVLKVDRSFLAELDDPDRPPPILLATLAMARGLGLDTVGEGVETPAQRDFLRRQGCAYAQGYLLGRPAPAGPLPPTAPALVPQIPAQPTGSPLAMA